MKRLFTMGLALLMVLTMVPMSCHASNLDAGIGAESVYHQPSTKQYV